MDYWNECIRKAFEDAGIKATEEQIVYVAGWVGGAHKNYGMAFGHESIPSYSESEIEKSKREEHPVSMWKKAHDLVICEVCKGSGELKKEQDRVTCGICAGTGAVVKVR